MPKTHYESADFLAYLERSADDPGNAPLQAHLGQCDTCAQLFAQLSQLREALYDPETWEPDPATEAESAPSDRCLHEFQAFMHLMDEEDARAETVVPTLIAGSPDWWRARLDDDGRVLTGGVIRKLLEEFTATVYRDPSRALAIAQLATTIAERLAPTTYKHSVVLDLRGQAWKDQANALRLLGRYHDALAALDQAETYFSDMTAGHFALLTARYVRATVWCALERYPDALEIARECAEQFGEYGDRKRVAQARLLEGVIHHQMGAPSRALPCYLAAVAPLQEEHDLATLAGVFSNLGECYGALGDADTAGTYYLQAIQLHKELTMKSEETRVRFSLGRTLIATGKPDDGVRLLRQAKADFEILEMAIEAGVVALVIAETLLALGQPHDVPEMCHNLVARFEAAGLHSNALAALAFLQDAATAGRATPTLVRSVREFLEALPRQPDLAFAPPPA